MIFRAFLVVLVSSLWIRAEEAAAEGPKFAEITYPAFGNIRNESGTLLVLFEIDEPMPAESDAWYQPNPDSWIRFMIARVRTNESNQIAVFVRPAGERGALWTSMQLEAFPPGSPNLNSGGEHWKTGELRQMAYTWDRDGNHRLWADGELQKTQQSAALRRGVGSPEEGGDGFIKLGSASASHSSKITVHALHVLDEALSGEELARPVEELFQPHAATLLLDVFEGDFTPDGQTETSARVVSGMTGERGGIPSEGAGFVQTPHGPALRLYTPPNEE